MENLTKDLVFLMLQLFYEENYKETCHTLEKESGLFFSFKYFNDLIIGGEFEEAEQYLSSFTKSNDNSYSKKIYFEIRKQKYLEALDNHDKAKAVDILTKELRVLLASEKKKKLYEEITVLLSLDNFRENKCLSNYKDAETARRDMMVEFKKLIVANPLFNGKLQFPNIMKSRLRALINQSLNWQHFCCANPRQIPDVKTLLVDHSCGNSTDPNTPHAVSSQLAVSTQDTEEVYIPLSENGAFQPTSTPDQNLLDLCLATPSSMSHPVVSGGGVIGFDSPTNLAAMSQSEVPDSVSKARPLAFPDRTMLPGPSNFSQNDGLEANITEELPRIIEGTLHQGSSPILNSFFH